MVEKYSESDLRLSKKLENLVILEKTGRETKIFQFLFTKKSNRS